MAREEEPTTDVPAIHEKWEELKNRIIQGDIADARIIEEFKRHMVGRPGGRYYSELAVFIDENDHTLLDFILASSYSYPHAENWCRRQLDDKYTNRTRPSLPKYERNPLPADAHADFEGKLFPLGLGESIPGGNIADEKIMLYMTLHRDLINFTDQWGRTLLHLLTNSCRYQYPKATKFFLACNPTAVNKKDNNGNIPLHSCAYDPYTGPEIAEDFLDVAERLISAGADVNAKNNDGATPLHSACFHGCDRMAKLLIAGGGSIEAVDRYGDTPLHVAADWSIYPDIIGILMRAGADPEAKNDRRETPISIAQGRSKAEEKHANLILEALFKKR